MSAWVSSSICPVSTALAAQLGVAVSLELRPDRPALGALAVVADLLEDAELVLDVVSVLVGENVRLRERRAAGAEARLQLVEEPRSM